EDTLDTWFSSALWPFSTLGWPDKTEDLEYFYPTNTLVTGYDIIPFWVMRMMFSGIEQTGQVPFDTVLIHGLVRDSQGRKMSKSLGNGIDPLEVIDEYGADALRFMLATGNSPGNDMRYIEDKVISARNFANKLWNASRYILMNLPDDMDSAKIPEALTAEDKWVLGEFNALVKEVTENLDKFELGVALAKIYDFIWSVYCDWYIELTKPRIAAGGETALAAQNVLVYVMQGMLKLLHPFMPFVTEEIWQAIPNDCETIMLASWPVYDEALAFETERREFSGVIEAVTKIRNLRSQYDIVPSKRLDAVACFELREDFAQVISTLARVTAVKGEKSENAIVLVTQMGDFAFEMNELVDKEKETARLEKEKAAALKDIEFLSSKLNNEKFVSKAPAKLVEEQRVKLAAAEEKLSRIEESLAALA
ncbi:MAG: class I tRNA ligase family protein, partial [Oscillospiraceae bacterium]